MSVWYLEEIEGVNWGPMNMELGLNNVIIFDPTNEQSDNGVVACLLINTVACDVRAFVRQSQTEESTLYLQVPQTCVDNGDGKVEYYDEVRFNTKVKAQILRFVHSQCIEEEV